MKLSKHLLIVSLLVAYGCKSESFKGNAKTNPNTGNGPGTGTNPSPGEVDIGGPLDNNLAFHIGDNKFKDSRCVEELNSNAISGSTFEFNFSVSQGNASGNVNIDKICGIDAPVGKSNIVLTFMSPAGAIIHTQQLTVDSNNGVTFAFNNLPQGNYIVKVTSGPRPEDPNDKDDFIIGHMKISADKALVKGETKAY